MRLRSRIAYKVLTLLVACGIALIISINYLTSSLKRDEFLTVLASVEEDNALLSIAEIRQEQLKAHHIGNITNFNYTLANDLCKRYDKELLAILLVTSYAGHDELRAAHRQAIAQTKLAEMGFQRVFLLAQIPSTERFITQRQLQDEQQRFGDLLQGNFVEAYRNLSYKHIMGLRWASTECARAKFIIKLDDDIVYDVFQLRRYLESLEVQQPQLASSNALLAGFVLESKPPIRNAVNKWYVTMREFPADLYPAYLSGWLYITNPRTALRLVREARRVAYFWIDDTWVTGVLRERLNIPMQRLNAWYSANAQFIECCVRDLMQLNYECEYYVGPNGGDNKLLVEFLHNVEKCYFDECSKRAPEKSLRRTCVAGAKHLLPEHGEASIRQIRLR